MASTQTIATVDINYRFSSEQELVDAFCERLEEGPSPWTCSSLHREFGYQRGRTDVIALDESGRVLAFEAKMSNWRVGVHQAYRNTCFADLSYLILPEPVAERASGCGFEFRRRSVGLCSVGPAGIGILIEAPPLDPLQPWLRAAARVELGQGE